MTTVKLTWKRNHESTDGRFWCYKPPRYDNWALFDSHDKDEQGNSRRYYGRTLADCKEHAAYIAAKDPR